MELRCGSLRFGERLHDDAWRHGNAECCEQLSQVCGIKQRAPLLLGAFAYPLGRGEIRKLRHRLRRRNLEQPALIGAVGREKRNGFHGIFGREKIGDRACVEGGVNFASVERTKPRTEHRLRRFAGNVRHGTRRRCQPLTSPSRR